MAGFVPLGIVLQKRSFNGIPSSRRLILVASEFVKFIEMSDVEGNGRITNSTSTDLIDSTLLPDIRHQFNLYPPPVDPFQLPGISVVKSEIADNEVLSELNQLQGQVRDLNLARSGHDDVVRDLGKAFLTKENAEFRELLGKRGVPASPIPLPRRGEGAWTHVKNKETGRGRPQTPPPATRNSFAALVDECTEEGMEDKAFSLLLTMAARVKLQPPPLLAFGTNPAGDWRLFKRRWDNYSILTSLEERPRAYQVALLENSLDDGAKKVYEGFHFVTPAATVYTDGGRLTHLSHGEARPAEAAASLNCLLFFVSRDVLFDRYDGISAKDHERHRRTGEGSIAYQLTLTSPLPGHAAIMKNKDNKRQLSQLLGTKTMKRCGQLKIRLGDVGIGKAIPPADSEGWKRDRPDFKQFPRITLLRARQGASLFADTDPQSSRSIRDLTVWVHTWKSTKDRSYASVLSILRRITPPRKSPAVGSAGVRQEPGASCCLSARRDEMKSNHRTSGALHGIRKHNLLDNQTS
ncbi:hypothetical protein GWK47_034678 [Chionoecetes opilio]|uniref:Uncharacterized protein n=1 Tax=Chionoecetes opilio TaxID=41210 RepID=A0A8J5CZU4_CHIOP|nr:hypothetical protein GWK47_034678 [Chionoecetes opilio]